MNKGGEEKDFLSGFYLPLLVASVMAISACQTTGGNLREQREISVADSKLVFYGPGLEDGFRRIIVGKTVSYDETLLATYGPKKGRYPQAVISVIEAAPGRHFKWNASADNMLSRWSKFKNGEWNKKGSGHANNEIGSVQYLMVHSGAEDCVVFVQYWGFTASQTNSSRINGFYCDESRTKGGVAFSPEMVVSSFGIKGIGVPPKPEHWTEGGTKKAALDRIDISVDWPGIDGALPGKLVLGKGKNKGGLLSFSSGSRLKCDGSWQYRSGKFGTDVPPEGDWSVLCDNGVTATGTYKGIDKTSGTGTGRDSEGRPVSFRYGNSG